MPLEGGGGSPSQALFLSEVGGTAAVKPRTRHESGIRWESRTRVFHNLTIPAGLGAAVGARHRQAPSTRQAKAKRAKSLKESQGWPTHTGYLARRSARAGPKGGGGAAEKGTWTWNDQLWGTGRRGPMWPMLTPRRPASP